ncbi:MAG: HAMP domain-containing histidine kinase [Nitrosarchaeum sp.]|nr:HAMP domain-containing histidine kinase [Nitrosarchaeum sp.]
MKIVSKTYLLIGVLVAAAIINLVLLYENQNAEESQSYSIIKAGDIKVKAEAISGLAAAIASGNEDERPKLEDEINQIQYSINTLKTGGKINELPVEKVPPQISPDFQRVVSSWEEYKQAAVQVENTSVFDMEATNALNYLLEKNSELILLADKLQKEVDSLDRDYNRHKQIATDLVTHAKSLSQQILLISIGEEENIQEKLKIERLKFDIAIKKLLQIPTSNLDVESVGEEHEELIPLPRQNSEALRQIDPLWEAMQARISILEERALLSPEYNVAKENMNYKKLILYEDIDSMLESWDRQIRAQGNADQIIIQVLLVVNIAVFIIVFFVIRQSFSPLEKITNALSKIKEGIYGEKIQYNASDEMGELIDTFNTMSDTIKQKEEESKRTDIAKDEFLAMITHELKTPLVPIQGYADILLSEHLGKLTPKQKERISIIKASSETLLSMISDLLDAQKLELGQLRMKMENTNIKNTITNTVELLRPYAAENNIEIETHMHDAIVNHDPERIKQVVSNLIKNSINAIVQKQGKIKVTMEDVGDQVKITVKDNGVGIPIEKQRDLFKKFYQVDASLTREKGGSGLGLAICKGIVENHGGKITVKSNSNQGAEFSFTLPKNTATKSPIGIA